MISGEIEKGFQIFDTFYVFAMENLETQPDGIQRWRILGEKVLVRRIKSGFKNGESIIPNSSENKQNWRNVQNNLSFLQKVLISDKGKVVPPLVRSDVVIGTTRIFHALEQIEKEYSRRRERELTEQEVALRNREENLQITSAEKHRQSRLKNKQKAASQIQRAWKNYKMRQVGILKVAKQSIRTMRLRAGAEEFQRAIAALTIQLAWRKYYRRKLLRQLHPNKRQLRLWDPEVIAMKQRALVKAVYGEQVAAPFWHPTLQKKSRPYWSKWIPSAAALSYNFAVDNYHPLSSKKGGLPTPFVDEQAQPQDFDWRPIEDEDFERTLASYRDFRISEPPSRKSNRYSYHFSRGVTDMSGLKKKLKQIEDE